jgi:hypothetical protein
MTKKYIAIFSIALVICLALGFGIMDKGPKPGVSSSINNQVLTTAITPSYGPNTDNVNALWTQSFDGLALPSGWLNIQDAGSGLYTFVASGTYPTCTPHSGAGMASFQSYSINVGSNASLVSQSFSLTGGAAKLGFWMMRDAGYATTADLINFKINTSPSPTGATLLGTINRAKGLAPVETGADGWYYYEFAIPTSFNTATNYIIFSAVSQYGNNMYLDDVSVNMLLATDVGTYSVDVPSSINTGAIVPTATVKNFGSTAQSFPVTMTINQGSYTSTKQVTNLAAGSTIQVSFDSWTAAAGNVTVSVYTQLTTDLDRTNDTLRKAVSVVAGMPNYGWSSQTVITEGRWGEPVAFVKKGVYPNDTGYIHVIGGGTPAFAITNTNYRFNLRTNTWDLAAALPLARIQMPAVVAQNKIYVIGGYTSGFSPTNEVDIYNPITNTWSLGATLPTAVGDFAVGVFNDTLIYVVGGYNGTADQNLVQIYSVNTNTWTQGTPKIGAARSGLRGSIAGNKIVIVGGYSQTLSANTDSTFVGTINTTTPTTITWTAVARYPVGTASRLAAGTPLAYVNLMRLSPQYVLFTGGDPTGAGTATLSGTYAYDVIGSQWLLLPNKTTGVSNIDNFFSCVRNDTIFMGVVGGYNGASVIANNEWINLGKGLVLGLGSQGISAPTTYSLSQNYPNPFNPTTKISYTIPKDGFVTLKVYDVMGREVKTLVNEFKSANAYSFDFNAVNLSSGLYFYKLTANGFTDIKKMMLIK